MIPAFGKAAAFLHLYQGGVHFRHSSTGCAKLGAASMDPWLQPAAPLTPNETGAGSSLKRGHAGFALLEVRGRSRALHYGATLAWLRRPRPR